MQTTLLGIATAAILALVAALLAPLFVDWERFRPVIETEASRLVGMPVRVTGSINAALLPTPSLTLRGLEAAPPQGGSRFRARSLAVELSLGPLMRGEVRAAEVHVSGPEFDLGLDSAGRLDLPATAGEFTDSFSIDRLNIDDGRAVLTDARSGSRVVLEKLWFNGDVRSLAGPFKGDGAFVTDGELYGYRVAGSRTEEGVLKLRLNVDPLDRPLAFGAEGTLTAGQGAPRFDGTFNVVRPAGAALASGETVAANPWHLTGRIKATTAGLLLEQVDFDYGPEERALKLTGTAELTLGAKPRFDGVLSARQVDLDRALATPQAPRHLPLAALKIVSDSLSGALRPSIPARLGISVDSLTLAGGTVQGLRGDIFAAGNAWNLESLEFRAPGLTQVSLSGRLDILTRQLGFVGPVNIESNDPTALLGWLEGTTVAPLNRMKPLRLRGEVTAAGDKIAVERLRADVDRKSVEGRLAYFWPTGEKPPRLEAELNATEIDIDALLSFADAARAGTTFEAPRELAVGLSIGRASVAGMEAREVSARLRRDAKGLQVEKLSVADFGGTAIDAGGTIDASGALPRGSLTARVNAPNLQALSALAEKFLPEAADSVRSLAGRIGALQFDAKLAMEAAGPKVAIDGQSGLVRFSFAGEADGAAAGTDWTKLAAANMRLRGKLEAAQGAALVSLLHLEKVLAVDGRPGRLEIAVDGPFGGTQRVDARLLAGGLDASADGRMRVAGSEPSADLRLTIAAADARPLRSSGSRPADALPLTASSRVTLTGQSISFDDLSATAVGTKLRGRLQAELESPPRIQAEIEADKVDAPSVLAAVLGLQSPWRVDASDWSAEPFARSVLGQADARIQFRIGQTALTPALVLAQSKGTAKITRSELTITNLEGRLAEGELKGDVAFNRTDEGVAALMHLRLADADAAALLSGSAITGKFGANVNLEGTGLSPAGLMGSLSGGGTVSLARAQVVGLNPRAFEVATRSVEQGVLPESTKVAEIITAALDEGRLALSSAEGVITVSGGQVRLTNTVAQAEGADLMIAGNSDLLRGELSARLTLSGPPQVSEGMVERPVVFVSLKGPIAEPKRSVDVSALTAWLTLRAVEQQSKHLEALEGSRRLPGTQRLPEDKASLPLLPPERTPSVAPAEQAPPLPPPVEIKRLPTTAEPKSVPPQNRSTAPKPVAPKPAFAAPSRLPLDLSPNTNN